jgi:hypothetical protein
MDHGTDDGMDHGTDDGMDDETDGWMDGWKASFRPQRPLIYKM